MDNNDKIAHLKMIQGIVSRVETNSFTLKALTMGLSTALLAFIGTIERPTWIYSAAGCLPIIVFWIMDANYLRLGRMFRQLYDAVRLGEVSEPFTMNYSQYATRVQSTPRIAVSWSVFWFYLVILLTFALVTVYVIVSQK